ncbi:protein glutamate methylesterase CheB associated with MCPs of class 40H, response receiver domain-containing [Geotalea daltonii FRC-32]|uniref:Protein-glutamate methylesterase/protein-glutamine glutaminase n=1 Tax=Geotalea daltonii (strain DSM 22248 / JCM 15807 / FRC-32) TaxID=316067 RepID=B9M9E9_GEODF|nr:chemotaxis response regulator protein-glutamate methylesterase [Geotalea daltonii]ACM20521.1 protein glutamate methylesterase CheB associated with MCPs of class 40H, response receiver domain-containing [Geotalea daltonii FRC-32]
MKKVRIVVIDDSAYNRRTITKMLEEIPEVEVVGYAVNGEEGIRRVIDLTPDLVTLDLEMPKMDGFTTLRIIMNSCPTPVIVISAGSDDEKVFKALELGAVDFIAKPTRTISDELLKIQDDLQKKVRSVFNLNMAGIKRREALFSQDAAKRPLAIAPTKKSQIDIIAIGASTGGPPALQSIFSAFDTPLPVAIVVSQHMPPGFTKAFAERLNRTSGFEIKEAKDGDTVSPGRVLIAPGGRNLIFNRLDGVVIARVVDPLPEDKYVPSVDAMFASCAKIYGSRMLAVVLTGMGNDGSRGVRAAKAAGGGVFAESDESAVVFGMPREAIATGLVDRITTIDKMSCEILSYCGIQRR